MHGRSRPAASRLGRLQWSFSDWLALSGKLSLGSCSAVGCMIVLEFLNLSNVNHSEF